MYQLNDIGGYWPVTSPEYDDPSEISGQKVANRKKKIYITDQS